MHELSYSKTTEVFIDSKWQRFELDLPQGLSQHSLISVSNSKIQYVLTGGLGKHWMNSSRQIYVLGNVKQGWKRVGRLLNERWKHVMLHDTKNNSVLIIGGTKSPITSEVLMLDSLKVSTGPNVPVPVQRQGNVIVDKCGH